MSWDDVRFTYRIDTKGAVKVLETYQRGMQRLAKAIGHLENLHNPRWLKRRARMRRKKARGYA